MRPRPAPFDAETSDRVWDALFTENGAALAIVEPNGQFSAVNNAFSVLLGRGQAELVRKSWQSVTHPDDIAADADMVRACVDGDTAGYSLEKRYLTPSGDVVYVRIWVRALRMYQRLACFVVHAQKLDGPSPVQPPAPVVMRPKMDFVDIIRDNPKQTLTALGAVILFCARVLSERNDMKEKLDSLMDSERRRAAEAQKRSDLEAELRLRRQFGTEFKNPEMRSPQ